MVPTNGSLSNKWILWNKRHSKLRECSARDSGDCAVLLDELLRLEGEILKGGRRIVQIWSMPEECPFSGPSRGLLPSFYTHLLANGRLFDDLIWGMHIGSLFSVRRCLSSCLLLCINWYSLEDDGWLPLAAGERKNLNRERPSIFLIVPYNFSGKHNRLLKWLQILFLWKKLCG